MEYPAKSLDFINVIRQNRRLLSRVVSVKLGNVDTCTLSLMPFPRLYQSASSFLLLYSKRDLHAVTSWSVSVVLTTLQIIAVVILEFLLEWQSVECASQGKLTIDLFLADIKVLHVEETCYISIGLILQRLAYTYRHVGRHDPTASQVPPFLLVVRTD